MAQLTREKHKLFGGSGTSDNFAQFGSTIGAGPNFTKDISTIQALSAWVDGFQAEVENTNKAPILEEFNAFAYEHSYQIAYIFEAGIPEWQVATTYYVGSIVRKAGTFELYGSLVANNLGNALPSQADNANWEYLSKPALVDGGVSVGAIPKVSALSPATVVDSALSEDGVNVITALPIKFPDDTTQDTAAAPITVQQSVAGSRAIGIVYQNTSGKPMFVTISVAQGPGQVLEAYTDAATPPTTLVGNIGNNSNPSQYGSMSFVVLPGNYYKVSGSASSITAWMEWT